ncbi:MAG: DUF1501 domain-containing protein [Planctomycetaceae bacterium]|nr:DUF1501 domain-containing protein [Planctomycetaceae bacterium]
MLRILDHASRLCDGVSRRDAMQVGALSLFAGMSLPRLLRGAEATGESPSAGVRVVSRPTGAAKSVILYNLLGGPSQMDMFDMKPLAPVEVRGEFSPIDTTLPGLQICEHLPNTARFMDRSCVVRTVTHGYNAHNPLPILTGFTGGNFAQIKAEPTDPPDIGAICQYLGLGAENLPGAVCMPCYPGWGESVNYPGIRRPGPYGGYLGSQYDPLFSTCSPTFDRQPKMAHYDPVIALGEPQMPSLGSLPEMTANRLDLRRTLIDQLDDQFEGIRSSRALDRLDKFQSRAYSLLCSSKTRDAFDLSHESAALRERYGRHLTGSSFLVARRLVEAGVPFISIHAEIFGNNGHAYDMHENNFGMLKQCNLPVLDQAWPALIEDLDARGLLDSTLVVVMGEMGRTPRINAKAGRDHWPLCGFSLLAGGGIKPGMIYGATDKQAAYPTQNPVSPGDLVATIYHLLGIDPHLTVPDRTGRPMPIAHGGEPIYDIVA